MAKISSIPETKTTKFERIYEDENSISVWKYDLNKQQYGPVDVEIKYKRNYHHPTEKDNKKSPTKK